MGGAARRRVNGLLRAQLHAQSASAEAHEAPRHIAQAMFAGVLAQKLEVQSSAHTPLPQAQFETARQASALSPGPQATPPLTKTSLQLPQGAPPPSPLLAVMPPTPGLLEQATTARAIASRRGEGAACARIRCMG
jgi:hypothetical protein